MTVSHCVSVQSNAKQTCSRHLITAACCTVEAHVSSMMQTHDHFSTLLQTPKHRPQQSTVRSPLVSLSGALQRHHHVMPVHRTRPQCTHLLIACPLAHPQLPLTLRACLGLLPRLYINSSRVKRWRASALTTGLLCWQCNGARDRRCCKCCILG